MKNPVLLYIISLIILVGAAWFFSGPSRNVERIIGPFEEQGGSRPTSSPTETANVLQFRLLPVSESLTPQSGTLSFQIVPGGVRVIIELDDTKGVTVSEPAHIHKGGCPGTGDVIYELNDVVNGKSDTVLRVSPTDLEKQLPFAVNIHRSDTEITDYTACANLN